MSVPPYEKADSDTAHSDATLAGPRRRFASVTWPIDCGRAAEESQTVEGDGFGGAPKLRNLIIISGTQAGLEIHWHCQGRAIQRNEIPLSRAATQAPPSSSRRLRLQAGPRWHPRRTRIGKHAADHHDVHDHDICSGHRVCTRSAKDPTASHGGRPLRCYRKLCANECAGSASGGTARLPRTVRQPTHCHSDGCD